MDSYQVTSFIEIEFSPEQSFAVGEQIHGRVHLYSNVDLCEVSAISMTLFGEEQVVFNMSKID